jgi:hypothetical protein
MATLNNQMVDPVIFSNVYVYLEGWSGLEFA